MKNDEYCEQQCMYSGGDGFATYCPMCDKVVLGYGTSLLSLDPSAFKELSGMVIRKYALCSAEPRDPRMKEIVLDLQKNGIAMLLCLRELKEFRVFLEKVNQKLTQQRLIRAASCTTRCN